MRNVTIAGKVTAFDEKTVTVIVNKKKFQIPRGFVKARDFKAGDAVLISLRGEDIKYFLAPDDSTMARSPASEKSK
jgi:hypothetical protein